MPDKITINVDGASRGNPGPSAIGVILKDEKNRTVDTISQTIGVTTNNQAEYRALIAGLKKAVSLGARQVTVRSDSELMVRQLLGVYRVKKEELKPLHREVKDLAAGLESFRIVSIPREQNREADRLCNRALDGE
ncbi:MAG: ribonuclease HI family protein [Dehalococcoidales bacterium]|nr:ribonuclease HI family protein [Dehalococcoidales bacterium]